MRQQVIAPGSIKNHLTSAWGFSTIIASGYATGGKISLKCEVQVNHFLIRKFMVRRKNEIWKIFLL